MRVSSLESFMMKACYGIFLLLCFESPLVSCETTNKLTSAEQTDGIIHVNDAKAFETTCNEATFRGLLNQCNEDISVLSKRLTMVQHDLAASEADALKCYQIENRCKSDYDEALQNLTYFKENNSRLIRNHDKKVNDLKRQISTIDKELENVRRRQKSIEEKYFDERKRVNDMDRELRQMHRAAMTTYFNVTLVRENSVKIIMNKIENSMDFVESLLYLDNVKALRLLLQAKIIHLVKDYKTLVEPNLDRLQKWIRGMNSIESICLFMISILRELSKIVLDWIDLTTERKKMSRVGRRIHRFTTDLLKATERNSENIVCNLFNFCLLYFISRLAFILLGFLRRLLIKKKDVK